MDNLNNLILYFVKHFPQKLGRTKLIKAIYLLDCEWYKLYRKTFSGLKYLRDNNGPFNTAFYTAKDELCLVDALIENEYYTQSGKGYEFALGQNVPKDIDLDPFAMYIASDIVEQLKNEDLVGFLRKAYATPPMLRVQEFEGLTGQKIYGEELVMDELRKPPKPLFSLKQVKKAAKQLDVTIRGTDEEYARVVNQEIEELRVYRDRAAEAWKTIQ